LNVSGNAGQVVARLMAAMVDRTHDRPRDSCAVKRQVGERDDLVIKAMVDRTKDLAPLIWTDSQDS
jgi:hypothetical protein